jgi:hypothetical protein
MRHGPHPAALTGHRAQRLLLVLGCAFALVTASASALTAPPSAEAPGTVVANAAASGGGQAPGGPSATLEQCLTAPVQAERSATFSGEMAATGGTTRMSMRIDVQERLPGDAVFHTVSAPGLGVWRASAPGVKVYRYLKQVTNLSAPAVYRAAVRFRWLNAKGKLIKGMERRTASCVQPAPAPAAELTAPAPAP